MVSGKSNLTTHLHYSQLSTFGITLATKGFKRAMEVRAVTGFSCSAVDVSNQGVLPVTKELLTFEALNSSHVSSLLQNISRSARQASPTSPSTTSYVTSECQSIPESKRCQATRCPVMVVHCTSLRKGSLRKQNISPVFSRTSSCLTYLPCSDQ